MLAGADSFADATPPGLACGAGSQHVTSSLAQASYACASSRQIVMNQIQLGRRMSHAAQKTGGLPAMVRPMIHHVQH